MLDIFIESWYNDHEALLLSCPSITNKHNYILENKEFKEKQFTGFAPSGIPPTLGSMKMNLNELYNGSERHMKLSVPSL